MNTFTELVPVIIPIASSAYLPVVAAVLEAKASGIEVPNTMKVIAVTPRFKPKTHPNKVATSPKMAVTSPKKISEQMKHAHPPM